MIWWVSLLYRRFSDHYTYLNKFVTISFQRKLFHLHVAHDIHVKINQHIYDLVPPIYRQLRQIIRSVIKSKLRTTKSQYSSRRIQAMGQPLV
jgi:hypothetical protein